MIKCYTADVIRTSGIRRKPVGNGVKFQCALLWTFAAVGSAVALYGTIHAITSDLTAGFTILKTAFFSTLVALCLIASIPSRYFK